MRCSLWASLHGLVLCGTGRYTSFSVMSDAAGCGSCSGQEDVAGICDIFSSEWSAEAGSTPCGSCIEYGRAVEHGAGDGISYTNLLETRLQVHIYTVSRKKRATKCNISFGARGFRSAAPTIWNSLPSYVRSCKTLTTFRRHLKSHFFHSALPTA